MHVAPGDAEVVIKALPGDFLVWECLAPTLLDAPEGRHQFLRVRKQGYTTFEVIDRLARHFEIPTGQIGMAGLKDEDAITEQFISLPILIEQAQCDAFSRRHSTATKQIAVTAVGAGTRKIQVGELSGNSFRLTLRGLSDRLADAVLRRGPTDVCYFVNYYDTQRFGVPGGPRSTHLIGHALIRQDWEAALALLRSSGTPESGEAAAYSGDAAAFFAAFDLRKAAFYRSAWASFCWNADVSAMLARDADTIASAVDGLPYVFPRSPAPVLRLLVDRPAHPYVKYRSENNVLVTSTSNRCTAIQAHLRIEDVARTVDGWTATLSFLLPSGAYATQAMRQYLSTLSGGFVAVRTGCERDVLHTTA